MFITACALISARGELVTKEHLHRVCGVHGRTFKAVLGRLLALGKLYEIDGKIGQKRAEKELKNARKRVEKWLKNLDNPAKPNGYDPRAVGNARAHQPPTTNKNLDQPSQPRESSPAGAREGAAGAEEAGLAGCSKISDEWIEEARAERQRRGLCEVDLRKEAEKAEDHWREHPPNYPRAAWIGRACRALPERGPKAAPVPWVRTKPDVPDGPPPPHHPDELAAWEEMKRRRLAA